MAKATYISDFEISCIKIGKKHKIPNATIARALDRSPQVIGHHVKRMEEDGTINDLPMLFLIEDIANVISSGGTIK